MGLFGPELLKASLRQLEGGGMVPPGLRGTHTPSLNREQGETAGGQGVLD